MSTFIGNCFISISSVLVVTLLATKVSDQSAYHSKICMYFILCIPPILSFYWPTYLIGENACSWKHEMNENNLFVLYPYGCYGMYFLLLVLCTRSKWFPPFHEWTYYYYIVDGGKSPNSRKSFKQNHLTFSVELKFPLLQKKVLNFQW